MDFILPCAILLSKLLESLKKKKKNLRHFLPAKLISPKPFDVRHTCFAILLSLKQKSHILDEGQCHRYPERKHLGIWVKLLTISWRVAGQPEGLPTFLFYYLSCNPSSTTHHGKGEGEEGVMQGHVVLGCPQHCVVCFAENFGCQAGNSEDAGQQKRGCHTATLDGAALAEQWVWLLLARPCAWVDLGLSSLTVGRRGVEPAQQEARMWVARSWRSQPWLGLHTGGFPCVLLDFNTADMNRLIWTRRNKINSYNKRYKELLAPLCPPQREWVTWPKPGRGHGLLIWRQRLGR